MSQYTHFPQIEAQLPELIDFVMRTAQAWEAGTLHSWQDMTNRVQTFFTPAMLEKVERVAPGWREMSSYANGVTLVHTMCVLTALLVCPEYQRATAPQQALLKWIVLFHDLAKQVQHGYRDHTHGFRSAAMAGEILPRLGFATTQDYRSQIKDWVALTNAAMTKRDEPGDYVQDNRQLPAIIAGIEKLFGRNTPAALVVKTVLLHISITVVTDWPQAAALTAAQVRHCVDGEVLPLLQIMMLVDSDGWALFDQATRERYRQETLRVFEELKGAISA
jgi:hypothetical protein